MHSPILIKSSSWPVSGRQPLRKCSSFWIPYWSDTKYYWSLTFTRAKRSRFSHGVLQVPFSRFICVVLSRFANRVLSCVSKNEYYTFSKNIIFEGPVSAKAVRWTLMKTHFQERRISILLRLDRNMTLEWHSNHYRLFQHGFLCTIGFGQFSLQCHLVLGILLLPSRELST